ncbi:FABP family protein [Propionibacterium freudenreichii]|uniref:FABP family protein n=1 Tax=Propionibacterium freudenreichii TaxID=1744 RepID=UPI00254B9C68|nr:FABP family protein [Propionibacterium freudenreichii]MDK9611868.1 FABP family protein [Propionibacterium freudenreichii]
MPFEIPTDLNPALMPLAWLIGRWQGNGHGTWPDSGDFEFGQQIEFSTNGQPYLHYFSQTYVADKNGNPVSPISMETGFWRPINDKNVDVVMCHPNGWSEVWTGKIDGAKIELVTDVVARTKNSELEYTGGERLYGNVEGDLLWTFDRAAKDVPLQPYMWGRLARKSL